MSKIDKISSHSYALTLDDGRVFTLSNAINGSLKSSILSTGDSSFESYPINIGEYKIVPYGSDNNLPIFIRNLVEQNNLGPGIIERQMGLLFGQGLYLQRKIFAGSDIVTEWVEDKEVQAWLDSWDYTSYIRACMADYLHLKGYFDIKYLTRGSRIGKNRGIAKLEHIPAKNARLEWVDSRKIEDVKNIIVGDYERYFVDGNVIIYPVWDKNDPFRHRTAAGYHKAYTFSRDFYSLPAFWGAIRWIIRGSEIPTIFKYVTDNGINLAYHIHAPNEYWEAKRETLRSIHPDWTESEVEKEISKLTQELLSKLTEVLSGKENAGKFFYTVDLPADNRSEAVSWRIEAIDQKIKDFVESQLKIAEASASAITSGMGLHPSLSNVMVNGKLASGSELLYAFKLYLHSDVEIASNIILESINDAIRINFPDKGLKLGFYHQNLQSEEALTSSARLKNQ